MTYTGPERRKHPRISARFIVSYRMLEDVNKIDISQTRNLSLGGMLLTTNKQFEPGVHLALEIRLPFDPNPIQVVGKVLESREVTKGLIYDTRLEFWSIDEKHRNPLFQTIDYYLRKIQST